MKETKASLIIEEFNVLTENHYTKSIKFRFDNQNEFIIISYRGEDLKQKIDSDRIIIKEYMYN